jgi:Leucine-rich repeat (LRR) protein
LASSQWHKDSLEEVRCPTYIGNAPCVCEASTDGLDFTCGSEKTQLADIRAVVSAARFAIKTLVVNNLDPNATVIPEKTFANGSVNDFTIKRSNLVDLEESAFEGTHQRLHTLSIHNSPSLTIVPRAVAKVVALKRLDLSNNAISEIYAYTFFGAAKLSYLNLEANRLTSMAENAFLGLENNLRELNLKDNAFQTFPMSAVKILKKLQSLNLAGNRIENVTAEAFTRLDSIRYLDLSNNKFAYLDKETLNCMPNLQRLWMANNGLEDIETGSLTGLHDLETIDLSGNSLTDLPRDIFAHTRRLTRVDLTRNSLKTLSSVFIDLYALEEVFLNDNLLLAFTSEWFSNTPNLRTLHLENNVLVEIGENALQPLKRLSQLYLSHNFLNSVQATYFRYNVALTSLHLDNNHICAIESTAFRGVPKLRALRLDNNNLRSISRELFSSLTSLTELHLQVCTLSFCSTYSMDPRPFFIIRMIMY